jgi:hypothetical protein
LKHWKPFNATNKNINCNIKKSLLQHQGKSAKTLIKSYYNISSTTNATTKKTFVATKKTTATSGENLLQQREKTITTSQSLLIQHRKKHMLQ